MSSIKFEYFDDFTVMSIAFEEQVVDHIFFDYLMEIRSLIQNSPKPVGVILSLEGCRQAPTNILPMLQEFLHIAPPQFLHLVSVVDTSFMRAMIQTFQKLYPEEAQHISSVNNKACAYNQFLSRLDARSA